ncbi:hypothetical protein QR680_016188 [Steinernema hermaphroditum]|uniref:G-protein coupled receptors family 1 profile domain-containing protein n=1 Tax=Steinernema hermaphroditum TaxID=289476 RepID=A0AA39HAC9_9BILA|nr:hypothetical protein QR680_016188 [Steinernema hermaphroditum]
MAPEDIVLEYEAYYWFPRTIITVSTAVSIPLSLLVMFLIVFKSPKHLRVYKYILLNITMWVFVSDVVAEIIFLPMPLFDILAVYSAGLAKPLGPVAGFVLTVFIGFLFGGYLVSLLFAFVYRYRSLKHEALSICGQKIANTSSISGTTTIIIITDITEVTVVGEAMVVGADMGMDMEGTDTAMATATDTAMATVTEDIGENDKRIVL